MSDSLILAMRKANQTFIDENRRLREEIARLGQELEAVKQHSRLQAADIMTLGQLVYDASDPPVEWKARAEALSTKLAEVERERTAGFTFEERADMLAAKMAVASWFDELYVDKGKTIERFKSQLRTELLDAACDLAAPYRDRANAAEAEAKRLKEDLHSRGACMSCIDGWPEPYGCPDCLNTGWEGGAPSGFLPQDRAEAAEAKLAEVERERDEARLLVTEANNSLFGSQAYFHSLNGGDFNKHHLAKAIEDLKGDAWQFHRAEAEAKRLEEALTRIADPRNIHFAGDAQVVARAALAGGSDD